MTDNPHNLPAHLIGMTQAKWDSLSPAERLKQRDASKLNKQLSPYLGKRVRVEPKREYGRNTFRVGITTGWQPVMLAVRAGSSGSSDIIGADETFTRIQIL